MHGTAGPQHPGILNSPEPPPSHLGTSCVRLHLPDGSCDGTTGHHPGDCKPFTEASVRNCSWLWHWRFVPAACPASYLLLGSPSCLRRCQGVLGLGRVSDSSSLNGGNTAAPQGPRAPAARGRPVSCISGAGGTGLTWPSSSPRHRPPNFLPGILTCLEVQSSLPTGAVAKATR